MSGLKFKKRLAQIFAPFFFYASHFAFEQIKNKLLRYVKHTNIKRKSNITINIYTVIEQIDKKYKECNL